MANYIEAPGGGGGAAGIAVTRSLHALSTEWGTDGDLQAGPINGWTYTPPGTPALIPSAVFSGGALQVEVLGNGLNAGGGQVKKTFTLSAPLAAMQGFDIAYRSSVVAIGGAGTGSFYRAGIIDNGTHAQYARLVYALEAATYDRCKLEYDLNRSGASADYTSVNPANWAQNNIDSKIVYDSKTGLSMMANFDNPALEMKDFGAGIGGNNADNPYGFTEMVNLTVDIEFFFWSGLGGAGTRNFSVDISECFLTLPFAT